MWEQAPTAKAGWAARKLAPHFATLLELPTDFCANSSACEAAILSKERAVSRLRLASKEALRTEALDHNQFDEVIRCRGCISTYSTPAKLNATKLPN
jgi:hypothetical protein